MPVLEVKPFSRLPDGRRFFLYVLGIELLGVVFLVVEPEPGQPQLWQKVRKACSVGVRYLFWW